MNVYSFEDLGHVRFANHSAPVLEAYRGTDIVHWHGQIEQRLVRMIRDAESANNATYANRLGAFLSTWRDHRLDGSINVETIDILLAASRQWAAEAWDFQPFFLGLSTSLSQLIASEQELPRGVDMDANEPMAGSRGGGGGAAPMPSSFGPQDTGGPSDLGAEGAGGVGGGMGGDMGGAGGAGTEEPPAEGGLEGAQTPAGELPPEGLGGEPAEPDQNEEPENPNVRL